GHDAALALADHFARDDDDVAVTQPGRGCGHRSRQVIAGAELGQPGHWEQFDLRRRSVLSHGRGPDVSPANSRPLRAISAVAGVDRSAARIPGIARIAPMLTTGLDGARSTTSAVSIASMTPGPAVAASAPTNAKLWLGTCAR